MATEEETPLYGIDKGKLKQSNELSMLRIYVKKKEIHARIDGKYSVEREQEAKRWIEETIGEPFPSDDFAESLKDGVILCK